MKFVCAYVTSQRYYYDATMTRHERVNGLLARSRFVFSTRLVGPHRTTRTLLLLGVVVVPESVIVLSGSRNPGDTYLGDDSTDTIFSGRGPR